MLTRPAFVTPMKAVLTDERPSGPGWVFERKLDGIRCVAVKDGGRTRLETSPFEPEKGIPRSATWVEPEIVAQIAFMEWTADGRLRHPSFLGLRFDKSPREVVREEV